LLIGEGFVEEKGVKGKDPSEDLHKYLNLEHMGKMVKLGRRDTISLQIELKLNSLVSIKVDSWEST